jgi:HK97 family phage portal protein
MGFLRDTFQTKDVSGNGYSLGHSLSSNSVSNLTGTGGSSINVLEEYQGFAWKAINIRAKMLSAEDLYMERLVGKKWTEDTNHEFNFILEGSEGQRDLSDMLEAHSKSMDLYGEAFWYFSKGEQSSKPMGVYLLDPTAMTVLVANQKVTGYVYQKDGDRIIMDLDEILHRKDEDPRNPFRGTGPMQAAGWFVRSARYVNTYINNFLENNAIPAGVIVVKETVNDGDWKMFKEQWTAKHAGIDNAGKTGFVRGTDLDFVKTGLSLGEVDFEKMKNTSRDDVMVMFGISKPMMAIFDDINRASAVTARQLFALTFTKPELRSLTRKLTKKVNKWYGKEYRVSSTNPMPEDEEMKVIRLEKGVNKWMTVNEARAADGLEPLGAEFDVIQVQDAAPVVAAPVKSLGKITIRTKKNTKGALDYQAKESFRGQTEKTQNKFEEIAMKKAIKVLSAQKAMVLNQLEPKKLVDAHFEAQEEAKKLADEILPVLVELSVVQGQFAAELVGSADASFKLTAVMEKYLADSIAKAALGFTEDTQAYIAQAIADGLNDGESIAKISKRIDRIYQDILGEGATNGFRLERLARTEVIKTSNEMTEAAYKQSGVVSKKEWFANPGHCGYCATLNGSTISLGSSFVPKGGTLESTDGSTRLNDYEDIKHPSAHPSCRCTLIPVINELEGF